MNSPFKFLDAYTRQDGDIFFGREAETDLLYNLINRNRLVLVYGPSGTGKTSLVQCGLGNRFDETDWLPLFIRRGTNMLTSLQQTLVDEWEEELAGNFWELDENPLPEIIQEIFEARLCPVYLIFDQLEEIFVLGSEEERRIFTQAVADVYNAKLPCRLLFVMREEYLAHLYSFERVIPSLFDRRLRVEAMSVQNASKVVLQSCKRFNIRFEDPENNPIHIIEKVSLGRSGVVLPYLQVYLDRFYQDDFQRTYPGNIFQFPPDGRSYPELEFTSTEIMEFGELEDILKSFLNEQMEIVQQNLTREDPNLPARAVSKVLGSFASLEGTKIPHIRGELEIALLKEEQVSKILVQLEQTRLLREIDGLYELAHDILALEIANQRTGEEEAIIRVTNMVRTRYQDFNELQTYLSDRELQRMEDVEEILMEEQRLGKQEWNFIWESQRHVRKLKRRSWNLRLSMVAAVAGFILATVVIVFALQIRKSAKDLEESLTTTQVALKQEQIAKDQATEAQVQLDETLKIAEERLLEAYIEKRKNLELNIQISEGSLQTFQEADLPSLAISTREKIDSMKSAIVDIDSLIHDIQASQAISSIHQ